MFYLVRLIIDFIYVAAIYIGFRLGIYVGMRYMFTDLYIAKLYCGLIGIALVASLFTFLKRSVIFFIKAVGLYSVVTKTTPLESIKKTIKQFDKVADIAIITHLITAAVRDIREALIGQDLERQLKKCFPIVSYLPFAGTLTALGGVYLESLAYLDECILAYSFTIDKPIIASLKDAITLFLKQSPKIVTELVKAKFSMLILNVTIVTGAVLLIPSRFRITFPGIALFIIIVRTLIYVLNDAVLEPFLMQQVVEKFIEGVPSVEQQFISDITRLTSDDTDHETTTASQTSADAPDDKTQCTADTEVIDEIEKLFELPVIKRIMNMKDRKETDEQLNQ